MNSIEFVLRRGIFSNNQRAPKTKSTSGVSKNKKVHRQFYLAASSDRICQTPSGNSSEIEKRVAPSLKSRPMQPGGLQIRATASDGSTPLALINPARAFPLPWSHVELIGHSRSPEALAFYQAEAFGEGWSIRQLRCQMDGQFYERTIYRKTNLPNKVLVREYLTALPDEQRLAIAIESAKERLMSRQPSTSLESVRP